MEIKGENILKGIPAAPGIAIAKANLYQKEIESISDENIDDVESALISLDEAVDKSKKELKKVFSLAVDKLGAKRAEIFEAQIMILDDPILMNSIKSRIKIERKLPEYIVDDEISKYIELMRSSHELYMKERSQDIEDIKNRIVRNLKKKKWKSRITSDVIVVAQSITPADTVLFARVNVKGYVTDSGGLTSHAAIVARSLNIPAVLGLHDATNRIEENDELIIDGFHGIVVINPTLEQREYYNDKVEKLCKYDEDLAKLKDLPAITKDGRTIVLRANLDLIEELAITIQNGAQGIGLVRTEQLFEGLAQFPDEDEQTEVYLGIAEKIYPEKVIIRAFDIGGDKVLPVDVKEPNPFLGWRGIRFLLDNRDLFKTQTRAILKASIHKNLKYMIPMIMSLDEVKKIKILIEECKTELTAEGVKFDKELSFGIMIEVPSAVVLAEALAKEVDFFSIGTNDLIQYILAVDRGNEIVTDLYQEFHPAVIATISLLIDRARVGGAKVSMCGEMAADPLAIPLLVGFGLDSISVSASAVPFIKKIIRSIEYSEVKELAQKCLTLSSEEEIRTTLKKYFEEHVGADTEIVF